MAYVYASLVSKGRQASEIAVPGVVQARGIGYDINVREGGYVAVEGVLSGLAVCSPEGYVQAEEGDEGAFAGMTRSVARKAACRSFTGFARAVRLQGILSLVEDCEHVVRGEKSQGSVEGLVRVAEASVGESGVQGSKKGQKGVDVPPPSVDEGRFLKEASLHIS